MNIGKKRMLSDIKNTKIATTSSSSASDMNSAKQGKLVNAFQMMMGGYLKKNKENVVETKTSSPLFETS